jgi:hypothetical protein
MSIVDKIRCLHCGSKSFYLVYSSLRRIAGVFSGKFQIRCGECGKHQTVHVTGTRRGTSVLRMVRPRKVAA